MIEIGTWTLDNARDSNRDRSRGRDKARRRDSKMLRDRTKKYTRARTAAGKETVHARTGAIE